MPINNKIRAEVEQLDVTEAEKELMLKILDKESNGLYFFKNAYEELIRDYAKSKEENQA